MEASQSGNFIPLSQGLAKGPLPSNGSGRATSETEPPFIRWGRRLLFVHLLLSPLIFGRGIMESFESPKVAVLTTTAILLLSGLVALWVNAHFVKMAPSEDSAALIQQGKDGKEKKGKKGRKEKHKEHYPTHTKGLDSRGSTIQGLFDWNFNEPITLGILLFLASAMFSTLFSTSFRTSFYGEDDSYAGLITIVSYTILFLGTKALCLRLNACRTLLVATLLGVAFSVFYGGIQSAGLDPFSWKRTSPFGEIIRIFGTMGHPNQLAAFLVMGFPIVCYFRIRLFEQRSFLIGIALIVTELFAAAIVVLSLSRGAWLAMGAMLVVFSIGYIVITGKKRVMLWALFPWIIGIALGAGYFYTLSPETGAPPLAPAVVSSAVLATSPTVIEAPPNTLFLRLQQMGISTITQGTRWPIWTAAFAMFLDHPILGVGLDAFRLAFMQYRPGEYWLREWGGTPTRAHNELLHILATQGGFGMVAVLMITFGIWKTFVRAFTRNPSLVTPTMDRLLLLSIFSGIVGFYVQNLFNFTVTGTGTLFMTFAALLSRLGEPKFAQAHGTTPADGIPSASVVTLPSMGKRFSFSPVFFVLSLLFVLTGLVIHMLVLKPIYASYLVAHTVFNRTLPVETATTRLEKAVLIDPTKDDYFHHLGASYRKSARKKKDPALRAKFLTLARDAYQRSIDLVPVDSNNHLKLATLLVVMAKETPPLSTQAEVYHAIKMAIKLDPNNADIYAIGADIAISFGDLGRASLWAKKCALIYPNFAPVRAQLGFVALLDAVRFLKNAMPAEGKKHLQEAIVNMERALPMFWSTTYEAKKESTRADLAKAYLFKARAEEQLGEITDARASYAKLLKMKPDHAEGILAFEAFRKRTENKLVSPP